MATLNKSSQLLLSFVFGALALVALFAVAIWVKEPNELLITVSRVTLALACAGVAAVIPGFIDLKISQSTMVLIRSGGAIAVFVLVYLFNPPELLSAPDRSIPDDPPTKFEPVAREWLKKIDQGDFEQAYDSASELSRQRYDRDFFVKLFADYLEPLGSITNRKLMGAMPATQLPNGDRGNYRVLTYRSSYQSGAEQIEVLVLAAENDEWVVQNHTYYPVPN